MRKRRYFVEFFTLSGDSYLSFRLDDKDLALHKAKNAAIGYYAKVNEIVLDGEDIVSNKTIYDGSDK